MIMPNLQDMKALRNMIAEAKRLLETAPEMPEGRTQRANELLGDAMVPADHLLTATPATLADGLAHVKGYIQACSDPLAAELDPICKGIGGHIHAGAVTPPGFVWLI
jgi:hypothetical protein